MPKRSSWEQRIARCEELLSRKDPGHDVLALYREVLDIQQRLAQDLGLQSRRRAGESLREAINVEAVFPMMAALLRVVEKKGPSMLAQEARRLLSSDHEQQRQVLLDYLREGTPMNVTLQSFFARVLVQPGAEALALQSAPAGGPGGSTCPLCGSKPQLAVLYAEGDDGKRYLVCSFCSAQWEHRNVWCPACEETERTKLPRYEAKHYPAIRVEACDSCKAYLKSFDMTIDGLQVPEVDEIVSVPMDLWAGEQGYRKIQLNVMGF